MAKKVINHLHVRKEITSDEFIAALEVILNICIRSPDPYDALGQATKILSGAIKRAKR